MRLFNRSSGLLSLAVLFFFFSCVQEPEVLVPSPPPVVFERLEGELRFYTIPTSETSLSFEFDRLEDYELKQVFLMQGSDTLSTAVFTDSEFVGNARKRVNFDYEFDLEAEYYFLVEVTDISIPNTRFTYRMPDYKHVFASYYNLEVIADLDRMIDYDFSPSRDFLFLSNFSNNEFKIHRLDLASRNLTTYFTENEINGNIIRATSDEEFLYPGLPDGPYDPTIHDQGFLRKININTRQSTYLGEYSSSYGRISRVIKNIIITNSRFPETSDYVAIDIRTGEVTFLGNFSNNFPKDQLDRHIIGEFEIDPLDFEIVRLTSGGVEEEHLAYFDQNDYAFYMKMGTEKPFNDRVPFYSLIVKKGGVKIYETPAGLRGYPNLFKKFNVVNNKFIYHKSFGSDTEYRIEGFYEVDLSTGEERLIHADDNPFSILVFDFGEKGMYGRRGDQFFSITKN